MAPDFTPLLPGTWDYWRPTGSRIVELGTVRGFDVALPTHFHDEDQMTFVLSGRRRFVIGNEVFDIGPGHGMHIPAGTPHRSLSEPSEVVCINMYTPSGVYAAGDLISGLARHWRRTGHLGWPDLTLIAEDHRQRAGTIARRTGNPTGGNPAATPMGGMPWETVSQAAQQAGMSREGFSRRFRRQHGMSPHAFWLLEKLNDARRLLRAGEAIAAVAADTGFADQSHLGRCFRRAFGVTPGRYRAG
ncbi:helix-turn-helix domain-containing protein [Azospirillum canadense]|uniref:helix-turn-helix domain-containing protein n=1 Tax=Azospirillum canadense TaxID=403962 RepID=UPI0022280362|nr:AraC family transcriptional regulator [Azospirillum canadense]MCW2242721.1 AraC-like DNA-binding protein [Azospirillum canadense]